MKALKLVLSSVALCISLVSFSQTDTTAKSKKDTLVKTDTTTAGMQQSATSAASATSESAVPKPNFGRYYIPVLGTYQASQSAASGNVQSVTVSGDESNAGKVWVEGLAPQKFYALLKKPGTYKIPAQTEDQKSIAEGTLSYDESSKQITICVGCGFTEEGATATATATDVTSTDVVAKGKTKNSKSTKPTKTVLNFTGTKVNQGSASAF